jgi:uncharacterized damage-inducible protein DinB
MTVAELMHHELRAEAAMTRRLLAKIPDAKLDWKPTEGLQTIGWNARHLAEMASWLPAIVGLSELDMAPADGPAYTPPALPTVADILHEFDKNLADSLTALQGVPDAVMADPWTLKMGGQTIFTMPKGDCIRKWVFSHTAHHRGILSVYLRLAGVPHPSLYEE